MIVRDDRPKIVVQHKTATRVSAKAASRSYLPAPVIVGYRSHSTAQTGSEIIRKVLGDVWTGFASDDFDLIAPVSHCPEGDEICLYPSHLGL